MSVPSGATSIIESQSIIPTSFISSVISAVPTSIISNATSSSFISSTPVETSSTTSSSTASEPSVTSVLGGNYGENAIEAAKNPSAIGSQFTICFCAGLLIFLVFCFFRTRYLYMTIIINI